MIDVPLTSYVAGESNVQGRLTRALMAAVALSAIFSFAVAGSAWAGAPDVAAGQQPEGRPGQPIIIHWSTETEVNTAGFNVYRSQSEEGPWEKINPRLVPASPDPLRGGSYVFTDTNVIAGVAYWYELEEVELSGQTTRLERTQATARSQGLGSLAGLQCASVLTLLMAFGVGTVAMGRRVRYHERP